MTDPKAREKALRDVVLDTFVKARAAKLDATACYSAATDVWCDLHPEDNRTTAASRVVAILHEELGTLSELAKKISGKS
jgi:hypothetical protein